MEPGGPPALASTIAGEIRRFGPMRFDRYMELALYAPGGYYDEPPIGPDPAMDFVTSPHLHSVFAQLVAQAIRDLHEAMGTPEPLDVVEVGAGDGTLLRGIVPELADLDVRAIAVERSPGARARLATIDGITVLEALPEPVGPTVIVAHELLDNMPFRWVRATPDGPREVHVAVEDDRLVETSLPVHDVETTDAETIVPVGAAAFLIEALEGPAPRALLAIDYGSDMGAGGPAHGYASHRVVEDVLADPGRTDITAGVDFGFLAEAARAGGMHPHATVSQRDALVALGLETWLLTELERQGDLLATGRGAEAVATWSARSRASLLADPAGLGRFRWFVVTTPGVPEPVWLRAASEPRSRAEP